MFTVALKLIESVASKAQSKGIHYPSNFFIAVNKNCSKEIEALLLSCEMKSKVF